MAVPRTAAQREASRRNLALARLKRKNHHGRPVGLSGLKKATVPYARVNKRSSTVGVNAGTIVPGTHKRIVIGGYVRIESTRKQTAIDKAISKGIEKAAPTGSRKRGLANLVRNNVSFKNPALRKKVGGSQVRLGTSRGAGPTLIVRRGSHKTAQAKSKSGIASYTKATKKVKVSTPRPQRRKKKS
jgi:hypothetical protein